MIVFDQVTKIYPSGHTALTNISFQIEAGEFVFLMGPSGSGKTTLLRLMLREIEPSEGTIMVANHDLKRLPRRQVPLLRRQIGSAFQDFKLIPDKSAFENVSIALEILGKRQREINHIAAQLLERVGLADKMHLFPAQLSGGEVQRVAIARAIATDPVLLFADEPTGNLDPDTSHEIVTLLQEIHQAGTTIIMATHDVVLANKIGYRQITLHKGALVGDTRVQSEASESETEPTSESVEATSSEKKKTKKKKKKKKD